jgi:hypothetical protein
MSFHTQAFGVAGYKATLREAMGFGEAEVAMACDILLESAPLLAAKNVVTLDDPAFVSSLAHLPPPRFNTQHPHFYRRDVLPPKA